MRRNIISKKTSSRASYSAQKITPNSTQKSQSQHNQYTYSYTTQSCTHSISELPEYSTQITDSNETVPVDIFARQASTMQAISRYLVDKKELGFTKAAKILGRNPKSIWTSYHQTPELENIDENTLRIPISIFLTTKSPLEALVSHLKSLGLRNVEIARMLMLDPKTVWTAAKRAEVRA